MKILALEFSSSRRSAALWRGPGDICQVVDETTSESRRTRAFGLLDELLVDSREVDLIAVGLGPGSYTGVRAALAIAQGWQASRNTPVQGISSMEALALEVGPEGRVYLAMDAQRGEFYLAGYEISLESCQEVSPLRLVSAEELKALLDQGRPVYGPDPALKGARLRFPSARAVAQLAATRPSPVSAEQLEPIYMRPASFVKDRGRKF